MTRSADVENLVRLFVYGSLKRGLCHHPELAGARFVSTARTTPVFGLYVYDYYPALVRLENVQAGAIQGELYLVGLQHLARLDVFEEVPQLYRRQTIALAGGTRAEAYLMNLDQVHGCPKLSGGEWNAAHERVYADALRDSMGMKGRSS